MELSVLFGNPGVQYIAGTHHGQSIETIGEALSFEHHSQLVDLGDLLLCEVTWVAILSLCGLDREVIVVVLGVGVHRGGGGRYGGGSRARVGEETQRGGGIAKRKVGVMLVMMRCEGPAG